ncbi:MAG: class I SAM-dependent methyltransferase [Acidobacteriota bacterium]
MRLNPRPTDSELERIQHRALGDSETEVGSFEAGNTNPQYPQVLAKILCEHGFPPHGGRVLDIGCGSGDLLAAVASTLDAAGTGLEMVDESLHRARTRFPRLEWVCGKVEEGVLPDASHDAVTLVHVLEHLTDPISALRIIHGWLKKDGLLIIEVPNAGFYFSLIYTLFLESPKPLLAFLRHMMKKSIPFTWRGFFPYHVNLFEKRSLQVLVKRAGFKIERSGFSTSRLENWKRENIQDGDYLRWSINSVKLILARLGLGDNLFMVARRIGQDG